MFNPAKDALPHHRQWNRILSCCLKIYFPPEHPRGIRYLTEIPPWVVFAGNYRSAGRKVLSHSLKERWDEVDGQRPAAETGREEE